MKFTVNRTEKRGGKAKKKRTIIIFSDMSVFMFFCISESHHSWLNKSNGIVNSHIQETPGPPWSISVDWKELQDIQGICKRPLAYFWTPSDMMFKSNLLSFILPQLLKSLYTFATTGSSLIVWLNTISLWLFFCLLELFLFCSGRLFPSWFFHAFACSINISLAHTEKGQKQLQKQHSCTNAKFHDKI